MEKITADALDQEVRSAFPDGSIQQVQLLQYGDEPEIEPGQIGLRIFVDQAPSQSSGDSSHETLRRFVHANRERVHALRHEQPSIGWIEFRLGGKHLTSKRGPVIRTAPGQPITLPGDATAEPTSVMTRLGPEDLDTVDTLITAGIASSRAEVLRWALGRIREHPAYAQIQERVREINELKAQF